MHTESCEPDDPNRCKGSTKYGQCSVEALAGQDYCKMHGGSLKAAQSHERRLYQLMKAEDQQRMADLSGMNQVKTLSQEIAMARMLLEKRWNLIKDDNDLIAGCAPLNQLLLTIERLIKSTHDMEEKLNMVMGRDVLIAYIKNVVMILNEELPRLEGYEDVMDDITRRMFQNLPQTGNPDTPQPAALPSPT